MQVYVLTDESEHEIVVVGVYVKREDALAEGATKEHQYVEGPFELIERR